MALDAIPNSGSQLERAVRRWFIDATADNTAAQGKLLASQIFVTNDSRLRNADNGIITLHAKSSQHSPEHTGTEIWTLDIQAVFQAANQPGQSNKDLNRLLIDRLIGLAEAAMRQTNDNMTFDATAAAITTSGRSLKTTGTDRDKANNFDMADFTCLFVRYLGAARGHPTTDTGQRDSSFWHEVRTYEITAAACAIN